MRRTSGCRRGFTLVETLVTIAVIGTLAALLVPALGSFIHRGKIEGISKKTSFLVQKARMEAMKRGVRTVVAIDPVAGEVFAFADVHGLAATDPSDGVFGPIGGMPHRTTDYMLARYPLPTGVSFTSPTDDGFDSVDGFANPGNPDPPDLQAIFNTDGSVLATGAFRFADQRGNYLEVRVAPQTTAKTQVRKYNPALVVNSDGTHWYARREGGEPWQWF